MTGGEHGRSDLHRSVEHDQGVLGGGCERHDRGAGAQGEVVAEVVGVVAGGGRLAFERPDEHAHGGGVELDHRQLGVVLERRVAVARRVGLRHPELDAVVPATVGMPLLGVGDAVAGGHQVQLAGPDHLVGPE